MNRKHALSILLAPLLVLAGCGEDSQESSFSITISNPKSGARTTQLLQIPLDKYSQSFNAAAASDNSLVELIDTDSDGKNDTILVAAALMPGESRTLDLMEVKTSTTPDLAHAELSVRTGGVWEGKAYKADHFSFEEVSTFTSPKQLTDHSYFLRYEGPGWESDKMGYRLYLDWRNAIDVFAKTVTTPSLHLAGQDGYESYHHMQDWGLDVLKAGKSLGVGALGREVDGNVLHFQNVESTSYTLNYNHKLSASFNVDYKGWSDGTDAVDVQTTYDIHAGDSATKITVTPDAVIDNLVTGIVDHGVGLIEGKGERWGYIASWGKQSLASEDDELGLALFYPLDRAVSTYTGEHDHLVKFAATDSPFSYYIMAEWPQHPDGVKSETAFKARLADKLAELDHPITVK